MEKEKNYLIEVDLKDVPKGVELEDFGKLLTKEDRINWLDEKGIKFRLINTNKNDK